MFALKLAWVVEAILSVWKWNMIEMEELEKSELRMILTEDQGLFMLFQGFRSMQHDAPSGWYIVEESRQRPTRDSLPYLDRSASALR